jgi:hypothetical protein
MFRQAEIYYNNLIKMYGDKGVTVIDSLNAIKAARTEINRTSFLTFGQAVEILEEHGIQVNEVEVVEWEQ